MRGIEWGDRTDDADVGSAVSRRVVAAVAVLVVLALLPAGAFSGIFASDTTGSGLVIDAAGGPNGDYADLSGETLALDFSAGGGLSDNAINRFDAVFTVTNDRSYEAPVWVNDSSDAITFYDTDTGGAVEGQENGVSLGPGETLVVGVSVDTRSASVSEVESTDDFSVETLVQESRETESSGTESTATDSTDTGSTATDSDGTTTDATATPTSTEDGSSDPGGGQPGGGSSESTYSVHDTDEGATVNVRSGEPSDPIAADLVPNDTAYASGDGTTVDGTRLDLTFERTNWRVEVTAPTDSPQDAPAVSGGEDVSYVRLDAYSVDAAAFDSIEVNLTVTDLPAGTDPSQVVVYRYTDDGWQAVETSHLGGDQYRASLDGFGELAVVVEDDSDGGGGGTGDGTGTSTTPADGNGSGDRTGDDTDGTVTTTATPSENETSVADPGTTPTATAVERLTDPLRPDRGLGPVTILVLGLFSSWLAVRARIGRNGPGGRF